MQNQKITKMKIGLKLLTGVLCLTSCQVNDFDTVELQPKGKIPIQISHQSSIKTRVEDNQFQAKDSVGLFCYLQSTDFSSKHYVDNMRFTFDGNTWSPREKVYYPENQAQSTFISYYPYATHLLSPESTSTTVRTLCDQSTLVNIDHSDFRIAEKEHLLPSKEPVVLEYTHELALVQVVLSPGKGFENAQDLLNQHPQVTFKSVATEAKYDFATLTLSNPRQEADVHPYGNFVLTDDKLTGVEAVLIPQTIAKQRVFIEVKTDEGVYGLVFDTDRVLRSKGKIICNVSLQRERYTGGIAATIRDWGDAEPIIGTAEEHHCRVVTLQKFSKLGTNVVQVMKEGTLLAELTHEEVVCDGHTYRMQVCYPAHEGKINSCKGFIFVVYTCDDASMIKQKVHGGTLSFDATHHIYNVQLGESAPSTHLYIDEAGNASFSTVEKTPIAATIIPKYLADAEGHEVGIVKIGAQFWTEGAADLVKENFPDGWYYPSVDDIKNVESLFPDKKILMKTLGVEDEAFLALEGNQVAHVTSSEITFETAKDQKIELRLVKK